MQVRSSTLITTPDGKTTRAVRLTIPHRHNDYSALFLVLGERRIVRLRVFGDPELT